MELNDEQHRTEEFTLDLEGQAESIRRDILSALSEFSQSQGTPAYFLAYVHPSRGQIQIYLRPKENISYKDHHPAAVLEFPEWKQASQCAYDRPDGLIVQMPDGTDALPEDEHQFSYLVGEYVCSLVRAVVADLSEGSRPSQIIVEADPGAFQEEWQP